MCRAQKLGVAGCATAGGIDAVMEGQRRRRQRGPCRGERPHGQGRAVVAARVHLRLGEPPPRDGNLVRAQHQDL